MKLNKKITLISIATLMTITPVAFLNNNHVQTVQAAKKITKKTIKLDYNSYLYNNKGKRVKTKALKKNRTLRYYNTKKIKGVKYYRIGKNRYVKAANVGEVDGKIVYVKETYVTIKYNKTTSYTKNGYANSDSYKKGQRVKVDQYIYIPASGMDDFTAMNDDFTVYFYHIKGQDDAYLSELDVTPRKQMKSVNYFDLHNTYIKFTEKGDMPIYTINGTASQVSVPHAATNVNSTANVDRLMYIWVPSEKKAELFYHLTAQSIVAPESDVYTLAQAEKYVGNGFVKASDAEYSSGIKLTPANTAEEAEKDAQTVATTADKADLNAEIAKEDQVKQSDKYRLTTRDQRTIYDNEVKSAKEVADSNTSTVAEVNFALWSLKQRTSQLDGAKVHVKNVKKLTSDESLKVERVADNANDIYTPRYNYLVTLRFNKNYSKLTMEVRHYSQSIQDPKYLISTTTKELNIADYATDK